MRVVITAYCVDLETGKPYKIGEEVDLPDARAAAAVERGLAALAEEPKKEPTRKRTATKSKKQ